MSDEPINLNRKDLKIEGDRNLYSYTFTDAAGNELKPEPNLPRPPDKPPVPATDDSKPTDKEPKR